MKNWQKYSLFLLSLLIVAFGQPAWSTWLSLLASILGYVLFWRVMLSLPRASERFFLAMGWYATVQVIQFSWAASHPYFYIYFVLFLVAWLIGAQWGFLALWIEPRFLQRVSHILALCGLWVFLEWSRLFIFSGLPFNSAGLALSWSIYPLQWASLAGMYGMSFWVMLTNLLLLRAWMLPYSLTRWGGAILVALVPYAFGMGHIFFQESAFAKPSQILQVVLVQPALPVEENMGFLSAEEKRQFILEEWRIILKTLQKQFETKSAIDLIVLPEAVVPYGTYHFIFPLEEVKRLFKEIFGDISHAFPPFSSPYLSFVQTYRGSELLVSNAYFAQTLATLFQSHLVIGFEDNQDIGKETHKREAYSAAFHFTPAEELPMRYEKRVLVPMGEYIPFAWCRQLAARYGVTGSLTPGKSAKVFKGKVPFGISICYEEIYGNLMRENRQQGAELLVNLTNDGWYPHSRLPCQHFDHARLRTVENGIPLVRACNTGVTGAIDSLGRIVGVLGEDATQQQERADSIRLTVPIDHYPTLYSKVGDLFILSVSSLFILFSIVKLLIKR